MGRAPKKWDLADLVDFEDLVGEEGELSVSGEERERFGKILAKHRRKNRVAQRRFGLRAWLEQKREDEELEAGDHVVLGVRAAAGLIGCLAFLAGVGVMRGLLKEMSGEEGMLYNLWVFLGVTIGLQWLVLAVGGVSYFFLRHKGRSLSVASALLGGVVRRFSLGISKDVWRRLRSPAGTYRAVLTWRMMRMSQGVAVCYNLGLLVGFVGCLWFFGVRFYFGSAIAPLSWDKLYSVMEGMSVVWSWSGVGLPPPRTDFNYDLLTTYFFSASTGREFASFLLMAIAVWGMLPRVFLWLVAWRGERRAFGQLDFQERRHRVLWRKLARDERATLLEGPADGVVLLRVGGVEVEEELLRGFLLRKLRVHAEGSYAAAVLDEAGETEALAAIRKAPLGVVFLVEGWALSPKEMQALYKRIKAAGKDRALRFLVLGAIRDGVPSAPEAEEFAQWERFVDGLRDPATEIFGYEVMNPDAKES